MTSERAQAYGRLMRRLRSSGRSELLPHEEEQIREAADALLFSDGDRDDEHTLDSLACAVRLIEALVRVGRWHEAPAQMMLRDLQACGPLAPVS
jgi:hypothetical protein